MVFEVSPVFFGGAIFTLGEEISSKSLSVFFDCLPVGLGPQRDTSLRLFVDDSLELHVNDDYSVVVRYARGKGDVFHQARLVGAEQVKDSILPGGFCLQLGQREGAEDVDESGTHTFEASVRFDRNVSPVYSWGIEVASDNHAGAGVLLYKLVELFKSLV